MPHLLFPQKQKTILHTLGLIKPSSPSPSPCHRLRTCEKIDTFTKRPGPWVSVCILSSPTRCLAVLLNPALAFQDRKIRPGQDKTRKHKNPKILDSRTAKSWLCLRPLWPLLPLSEYVGAWGTIVRLQKWKQRARLSVKLLHSTN